MDRTKLTEYILNNYITTEENPWFDSPEFSVFRHPSNKKWFALIMPVFAGRLGLSDDKDIDIINLKCEPFMIDEIVDGKTIFRAYHMNKTHWLSVCIDKADENKLKMLVDISFELTDVKRGKRQKTTKTDG